MSVGGPYKFDAPRGGGVPQIASEPASAPQLIETMRAERGRRVPLLEGHLRRLRNSSTELGYAWPGEAAIRTLLLDRLATLDATQHWRLRLLLSPEGELTLQHSPLQALVGPLTVSVQGPRIAGAEQWLRHKTTHRPWYEDAAAWLEARPQVFDVLFWNEKGEMCEGTRSNLYMQAADGAWVTPPISSGALPGVERQTLLESGQVQERPIRVEEFILAPARRISNALRGWCDIQLMDAGGGEATAPPHRLPPDPSPP